MAGSLSDAYEDIVADDISAYATHLALYTTAPTDSTAGTEVANSNSYARIAASWNAASGGVVTNNGDLTWPTASGSWGTVVAVAAVTSGTHGAGAIVWYSTLDASKAIGSGDVFEILDDDLTFTLT